MNLSPRGSNALAHSSSDTIKFIGSTEDKKASHQVRWDFELMHNTGADTCGPASGDLISEALSQLPVDDRAKAFDEIHGVQGPSGASRQFVESKILALQHQLRLRIQHGHDSPTRAFSLAAMQNSEFAYHPVVCERFLFASDFDVFEAASAIFRYYDLKYQLWGEKKLTGEVELDDLMETDIEILKMGCFQVLPERDRAGRQIGTIVLKNQKFPSMQCAVRENKNLSIHVS